MAIQGPYKNCGIYLGRYNLSGDVNQVSLTASRDALDDTRFGDGSKVKVMGLKNTKANVTGAVDLTDDGNDEFLFGQLSATQTLMSILPQTSVKADVAHFFESLTAEYTPGAKVGDIFAFTVNAEGTNELVNGTILINEAISVTGTGTAYELGVVGATEYVYGGMHVVAASGTTPTLDLIIESDDVTTFLGTPSNRIIFDQFTTTGSLWETPVAGAINDTWWRVNYTITGTNPSFTVLVVMGIQ